MYIRVSKPLAAINISSNDIIKDMTDAVTYDITHRCAISSAQIVSGPHFSLDRKYVFFLFRISEGDPSGIINALNRAFLKHKISGTYSIVQ